MMPVIMAMKEKRMISLLTRTFTPFSCLFCFENLLYEMMPRFSKIRKIVKQRVPIANSTALLTIKVNRQTKTAAKTPAKGVPRREAKV